MKRKLTFALHPKTGFIKRPRVSEIVGSGSSPGQALTLGCEITDFYPPNITVTWLILREGEQDDGEQEVLEGGEVWGPVQTHPRVYRATATLRRHATGRQRKPRGGGGIVCRVEHCSLLEPLEKHWRNVDLGTSLYGHVKISFYNAEDFPTRFNPLGKSLAFSFSFTPLSVCSRSVAPSIPPSISVCWSSEGVGVFSLLLKGGHPKVKLLWAAGGPTLSPLVSVETEEIGDDGRRELKSVCALERSTSAPSHTNKPLETRENGHAISTNK